jgi:predicted RNA-binding protein with PIN domain
MRWLVDGYNVVRRDPDLRAREAESLEAGRRALLHLLARARRPPQDEFTVVFDGARPSGGGAPGVGQRIRVVFSRPPATADDELMRLARQLRNGAVVVSSDRKVQDAARRAGSAVLTAEQFLEALGAAGPVSGSEPLDKKDDFDDEPTRDKRGNPRRLSKKARLARRALGRLRQP